MKPIYKGKRGQVIVKSYLYGASIVPVQAIVVDLKTGKEDWVNPDTLKATGDYLSQKKEKALLKKNH